MELLQSVSVARKHSLLWPYIRFGEIKFLPTSTGASSRRMRWSDFETFFQIVHLTRLRWKVASISVLVAFDESSLGQSHLLSLAHVEEPPSYAEDILM